jgi:MFS family permease
MFASLAEQNVRIFFAGLGVSNIGTWAQTTAVILLIQRLGGGGLDIGLAVAAQFVPVLILGLWAGAYADRRDRHRLTMKLQTVMGLQAVALGALDLAGLASIPLIYGMQAVFGTLSAIDTPARRALVTELVEPDRLANVLSLSTSVMTGARMFGPSLAALLVPSIGTGWVFVLNGVSYLALVAALASMDTTRFHRVELGPRSATPVRDGLRAVWADVPLRALVLVLAVIATFTFNHLVYLPLLVAERVGDSERAFGWLLSVLGIGNVAGALSVARLVIVPIRWFYLGGVALGATVIGLAFAPAPWLVFALALPMGAAMTIVISSASVILQQRSDPAMRGRLLALSSVILMGSTPIGGPITGLVADGLGVFWATAYGGIVAVLAVAIAALSPGSAIRAADRSLRR